MKLTLRFLLAPGLVFLTALAPAAESVVTRFAASDFQGAGKGTCEIRANSEDGKPGVLIENRSATPVVAEILRVESPRIAARQYAMRGELRCENVEGTGYLEMWSHFPGGGAYFSRTLGEAGPMAALHGTSGWRPFLLPFDATGATGEPERLVVNLHLEGRGLVELRNLELIRSPNAFTGVASPWWSGSSVGLIAGLGGALLGCLGSLAEWLVARGRARNAVLAGARIVIGLGIAAVIAGVIAAAAHQPAPVWYALLLTGALCVLILPFRLRRYEESYRAAELRRMTSLDTAVTH